MIRTFNSWFIVVPLTWFLARIFAFVSVTSDDIKAKKRISDLVWALSMVVYAVAVWVVLSKLFIAESLLGMIEYLGGNGSSVAGDVARIIFYIVAAAWAIFICLNATRARKRHYDRIENDYSLAPKTKKATTQKPVAKKSSNRSETPKSGNILFYDFEQRMSAKTEPTDEQKRAINYRVQMALKNYVVLEMDNTKMSYTDDDGKEYPIAEYLPTGVYTFFVAANLKDESEAPLFLGTGTKEEAEENLKRHLEEEIKAQVCSKRFKHRLAMNQ